ncbi:MAG: inositol monophosphatase family protein [Pseudomonadota bacterium]|nr:inositol monophosphatase family protein [Pseudomonadota bacterium]
MASQSALINVMQKASIYASKGLLRDFGEVENLQVSRKGPGDFVSRADINAEKTIRRELSKARPDWGFHLEEGGVIEGSDPDAPVWVVDPLDGTTNFLHGIPHFGISIAVMETDSQGRRNITAGSIFDPVKNEFFFAERGKGAFLNERRLRVSGRRAMGDSLFATGIPFLGRGEDEDHAAFLKELGNVMAVSSGVRRNGAAALDLAWVAAGRFDGFWERGLSLWDIAAGVILVREAGGFISDFASRDKALESGDVVAANSSIHGDLIRLLRG